MNIHVRCNPDYVFDGWDTVDIDKLDVTASLRALADQTVEEIRKRFDANVYFAWESGLATNQLYINDEAPGPIDEGAILTAIADAYEDQDRWAQPRQDPLQ